LAKQETDFRRFSKLLKDMRDYQETVEPMLIALVSAQRLFQMVMHWLWEHGVLSETNFHWDAENKQGQLSCHGVGT
jgi:hypothetical protein